jgi:hypothetical protein
VIVAKVYCVSYDLNRLGQRYKDLHAELEKSLSWWHYLDSTWLILTNETANTLVDRLRQHMDDNDYILVIAVKRDYQGWLSQEAWDWINKHVPYAA